MYDMYPWNDPDPDADSGANHHQQDEPAAGFTHAVQVALDRRDNGGDGVAASQPTARLTRQ